MEYKIEFRGEKIIDVKDGQSILDASLRAGIPHYHECGGHAKCSTCRILVLDGAEALTMPNEKELRLKNILGFSDKIRLACQTKVIADGAVVRRIIRDKTDVSIYSNLYKRTENYEEVGEERELALFFLDIRNFTPFMEGHLPFDVIHIMRRLFQIFKSDIKTHNGQIIETAGDGFYAVFGMNGELNEAVNSAASAGYRILDDLRVFNQDYMEKYFDHQIEVGIGLHVGHVIVGNIGLGISNNLTVMGLPVNIASRLQSVTKEINNNFIISEYAHSFLYDHLKNPSTKNITLKGVTGIRKVFLLGTPYS